MRLYIPITILLIMLGVVLFAPDDMIVLGANKNQLGYLAPMLALLVYFVMGHGIGGGQPLGKTLKMILIWLALFAVVMLAYTQFS
jgi:hypothetical protein